MKALRVKTNRVDYNETSKKNSISYDVSFFWAGSARALELEQQQANKQMSTTF